ncbi:predicted protein [Naegleria gruberi]|uniref:Predicted protein n=1 Tax=Naegleria gruberi TaxID=5762 RepID=D2UZ96_NAEGR|nr:uncharacterized protein NAEGRDRAFT_29730 [Naegleria gruberi]EFC49907.1 predicted protein [Naegleria gruberi]|eukprot:XP_002682651.1 predicted protein [Naegleria gruberi strain NEG-M]
MILCVILSGVTSATTSNSNNNKISESTLITTTATSSDNDSSSTTTTTILGYVGSLIAILFYGSNYVVTKKYPTGDGVAFSWLMSNGIFFVGFISLALTTDNKLIFVPTGLLSGSIWATGNLLVIPIIKCVGLGLGFLLWSGANLIGGYCVGKLGLFGVEKEVIDSLGGNIMNIFGLVCGIISLLLFFFIKPPQEKKKNDDETPQTEENTTEAATEGTSLLNNENEPQQNLNDEKSINDDIVVQDVSKFKAFMNKLKKISQHPAFVRLLGIGMAITAGCLYAVNLTPFKLWVQHEIYIHNKSPGPIDFAFSHFSGIYLLNSAVFLIYILIKKNQPEIYPNMIMSSIISGAMWGIATIGLLYSSSYLGFTVGYPLVAIGPSLVSTFWNVCVFREITGVRNLIILSCSLLFALIGVILLAVSKII